MILIPLIIGVVILIIYFVRRENDKYEEFITKHNNYLKELYKINKKYKFENINTLDWKHNCEEEYYINILPIDYLIYKLDKEKNYILSLNNKVIYNKETYNIKMEN